jgi:nucleoid DNA-binding protein
MASERASRHGPQVRWGRIGAMTKADIVDQIADRTGLTKKDVADTVDGFLDAVSKALSVGQHIEIRGFGTFKVKDRKSRLARNPRTGEAVPVPPRRVPVFKVSKELKDQVAQHG